ncbi:MAG: ABC transporter permease [Petrimonas sp.]|jgi:ABC-2 type transport system permease protein|uniref:ABC transporter permease n=1 Tax=Petrimonas sp. TaxID=2023866 RepID=UPI002A2CF9B4|nr:ABC transporter permease [Petrimonas sp.]MDD3543215.1 ABC transporter permease [Petrimonas sp.]HOI79836.1 ABC transporter permease [Petrimonas sp.]
MKTLKFLIEKEFKQMFRNPLIPRLIVLFPTMVLLVFPWAVSFEIKNIRVDVVDHSKSVYSKRLTDKIAASQYFILHDTPPDYNAAMLNMENDETDMILEIPASFDVDLVKRRESGVGVAVNSVNGTQGLLGSNYVMQIVNDFSSELRGELTQTLPPQTRVSFMRLKKMNIVPQYKYNPALDYKKFMIPGFMVLLLTILCGILPALNIVMEKENGTINQINVTPISKMNFILAKLIPYWAVGLVVMIISITLSFLIYGLWPGGGVVAVLISAIVFILSVSGLGIIISNYSETMQQASFLVMFFILILVLLGGMFTPVSSMPAWAQAIAAINPFNYLTTAFRMLYLNGSSLADVSGNLLALGAIAVVLNGWAVFSYKKRG